MFVHSSLKLGLPVVLTLASIACSSSSPGGSSATNEISGMLGGKAVKAQSAATVDGAPSGADFDGDCTVVYLSDQPAVCGILTSSASSLDSTNIVFFLASVNASGKASPASMTGTYAVSVNTPTSAALSAEVFYDSKNEASSGTVTVTSPDEGNGISGTFDLTFMDGSHATGSFDATTCPALAKTLD